MPPLPPPPPPEGPPCRMICESDGGPFCPYCHSSMARRPWWKFWLLKQCIQPLCPSHRKYNLTG